MPGLEDCNPDTGIRHEDRWETDPWQSWSRCPGTHHVLSSFKNLGCSWGDRLSQTASDIRSHHRQRPSTLQLREGVRYCRTRKEPSGQAMWKQGCRCPSGKHLRQTVCKGPAVKQHMRRKSSQGQHDRHRGSKGGGSEQPHRPCQPGLALRMGQLAQSDWVCLSVGGCVHTHVEVRGDVKCW